MGAGRGPGRVPGRILRPGAVKSQILTIFRVRGRFLRDFAGFSLIFDFLRARGAEIEVSIGISEAPRRFFTDFRLFEAAKAVF